MGRICFEISDRTPIPPGVLDLAHMTALDGIPWQGRTFLDGELLVHERPVSESGSFHIPWQLPSGSVLTLATGSLMERERPYDLATELARGTLHRVRSLEGDMRAAGYSLSDETGNHLREATKLMSRVATAGPADQANRSAQAAQVIVAALAAETQLLQNYSQQALAQRTGSDQRLPTLLMGLLHDVPATEATDELFRQAFNGVVLDICWRNLEPVEGQFDWKRLDDLVAWCHQHGLKISAGPLLRMNERNLPSWMYLWEDDFDQLQQCVERYLQAVIHRLQGNVHIWDCLGGVNLPGALGLGEEQRFKLTVTVIETVKRAAGRTPVILRFDQPWAEYLVRSDLELSPQHFAESMVRAQVGLAGLGLDINAGYWPQGTLPREPMELARLVERWSQLGVPLLIGLSTPSAACPGVLSGPTGNRPNLDTQAQFVEQVIPTLLAKPNVHGLVWNTFVDSQENESQEFPQAGLIASDGTVKPALERLIEIRQRYLT